MTIKKTVTSTAVPTRIPDSNEQTFDTIVGHDSVKQYFRHAVEENSLPHALLIYGPSGVGKTSCCYALIRYILAYFATDKKRDWYNDISRRIAAGVCVDIQEIGPSGPARQITLNGWRPGKDDPDDLQYYRFVEARPLECPRKFLIFQQADRMNLAVANFLLKLIEEPPEWLTIILLTSNVSDILPTIRSRTTPIQLSPLNSDEMTRFMDSLNVKLTPEEKNDILHHAEGRPGRMVELLNQKQHSARKELADLMVFFIKNGFLALFRTVSDLLRLSGTDTLNNDAENIRNQNLEFALRFLQSWLRDVFVLKTVDAGTARERILNKDCFDQLTVFADDVSLNGVSEAIEYLDRSFAFAVRQTDAAYVLETLLLEMGKSLKKAQ